MESKKINQLATELAPDLSDLTIIGDPTTGISKKITLSQMASLFTGTVEEYANLAAFPITGVADTIYIALDTNVIYRWDSTAYVVLSPNIIASLVFSDANGFDGTISLVGSVATLTITTALTSGSVPFIGASGALTQDNSNLFFDDTNNRLGIATALPTTPLDVFGSGIIGRLNATSTNNAYLGFASNGTNKWSAGNVQSDHRFRIFSEANSAELITILQTGEFGIGISNPTTKFHIDGAASALIANLDANVSIAKSVSYRSDNSARINLEVSGTESGSNVGADFFLRTFTDAGSLLETPFTIVRSTGVTTIKSLTLTNVLSVANGGTGSATQNFVDLTSVQTAAGAKTFSAITTISNATASTSTTTGGLVITGGVGIGGALFGTSATFSGLITSTAASDILTATSSNTAYKWIYLANTGGNLVVGINNSAGGATMTTAAYSSYIFTRNATDLVLGTNEVPRLTIASTGAATFTGTLTGTTADFETTTGTRYLQIRDAGTSTPSIRSVNNTITQLRHIAIEANTISLRTGASSGLTVTEALGISATGAATFSSSVTISGGNDLIFRDASTYISSPATDTLRIITANTERMRITSGGNVGIGSGGYSNERLDIQGADATSSNFALGVVNSSIANLFYVRNDGQILFGTLTNSPYNNSQTGRTAILASNGVLGYLVSTKESKANIESITNIDFINKLNPVQFNYRKKDNITNTFTNEVEDNITYGFIADEVEKINKELVFYNEDGTLAGVEYNSMIAILTKAVQELKAEIDILKAK